MTNRRLLRSPGIGLPDATNGADLMFVDASWDIPRAPNAFLAGVCMRARGELRVGRGRVFCAAPADNRDARVVSS